MALLFYSKKISHIFEFRDLYRFEVRKSLYWQGGNHFKRLRHKISIFNTWLRFNKLQNETLSSGQFFSKGVKLFYPDKIVELKWPLWLQTTSESSFNNSQCSNKISHFLPGSLARFWIQIEPIFTNNQFLILISFFFSFIFWLKSILTRPKSSETVNTSFIIKTYYKKKRKTSLKATISNSVR